MQKLSEIEIRRKLARNGYMLQKERKSKTNPESTGGYMVFDMKNNAVAAGGRYNLTLQGVADFLNEQIRIKTQPTKGINTCIVCSDNEAFKSKGKRRKNTLAGS